LVANDAVDAACLTAQKVVAGVTLEITDEGNANEICPPFASAVTMLKVIVAVFELPTVVAKVRAD